jgi:hypothetical protein
MSFLAHTVIHIAMLPVLHARQYFTLGGLVALELIGDDHPWDIPAPLEELADEFLRRRALSTYCLSTWSVGKEE